MNRGKFMNLRQKLIYTGFGSLLIIIGMLFTSIISRPLIALENGVFDKVICKEFAVVDKAGNPRILIDVNERATIGILDETGDVSVYLVGSEHGPMLNLNYLSGEQGIVLSAFDRVGADIRTFNKTGKVMWESPFKNVR